MLTFIEALGIWVEMSGKATHEPDKRKKNSQIIAGVDDLLQLVGGHGRKARETLFMLPNTGQPLKSVSSLARPIWMHCFPATPRSRLIRPPSFARRRGQIFHYVSSKRFIPWKSL